MRASVDYESLERLLRPKSAYHLADMLGMSKPAVSAWRNSGKIPVSTADRIACQLDLHVLNIWPDFYEAYSRAAL